MSSSDPMVTIPQVLCHNLQRQGSKTALLIPSHGEFLPITWNELGAAVFRLASFLQDLGITPGDRVALIAENRFEWIAADLAILMVQGVNVPIHVTLSNSQMAFQVRHSEARAVILSGRAQADTLAETGSPLTDDCRVLAFDDWSGREDHSLQVEPLADVFWKPLHQDHDQLAEAACREIRPEDLATILYTSGTTGDPKGVMLSHANLLSNAIAVSEAVGSDADQLRLCFLPLSHVYARTCDLYAWLCVGSRLALAQSRETILADCAEVHPTVISGVPYFYEKLCRGLQQKDMLDTPGTLRAVLGGAMRVCFSGGAALPEHVERAFESQGLPLLQGYGLSETSPVITASTRQANKIGAVGRVVDQVEVKISTDGEVLTRGPHVMLGYWQNEAATRETIRDGWLRTGDLGELDEEGFLTITGRKKEMIVMATGKNVAPTLVEGRLLASPLIAQAMVVGDRRNYLAALLVPEGEALSAALAERSIAIASHEEIFEDARVEQVFREEIDRQLAGLSKHEQVGPFLLLDRTFSLEAEELTPKGSMRRDVIADHFADAIDQVYASSASTS